MKPFSRSIVRSLLATVTLSAGSVLAAEQTTTALDKAFLSPPEEAKPLTWWHWLDGTITREGITADLEAMKRAGLGGAYMFNAGIGMPEGPVRFLQPEWLALMDHTLQEAKRLGLQFGIHNCDGFSQSGGPWITPETSMKQLTWTALEVEGPAPLDRQLEQPPTKEHFYRDIAVIAFPAPQGSVVTGRGTGTTLSGSVSAKVLAKLTDGDPDTVAAFPVKADGHTIDFVFAAPRRVHFSFGVTPGRPQTSWRKCL